MAEPGAVMMWEDVPGWLTSEEGAALQSLALARTVLELGSWKGRSTVCLAEVADLVVSVDWHIGDSGTGSERTLPAFLANLGTLNVVVVIQEITVAARALAPHAFDLVFIDDDHFGDAPERSTQVALRCVRPGGVIAWHDYGFTAVRAAVEGTGLPVAGTCGSLVWVKVPL